MSPRITQSIIVVISLVLFAGQAPRPRATTLTIDQIMEGPDFAGTQPSEIRWSVDGHKVYFRWKTTSEKKAGLYTVDANGGVPRRLTDEEEKEAPPADGVENAARTRKVYVRDGDVYLLDLKNGARRRMTATVAEESNPGFTLDPDHLYFTRDNNLYLLSISTGVLEQLTDFRRGPAPRETKPTPSQKFLEDQQKELFKSVQEKAEDKKIEEEKKKAESQALWKKSKKEIDKSLLLYGAIKGMGEALSWEAIALMLQLASAIVRITVAVISGRLRTAARRGNIMR